jgi:hypothetical protein
MNDWHRNDMVRDHCDDILRKALEEQALNRELAGRRAAGPLGRLRRALARPVAVLGAGLRDARAGATGKPAGRQPGRRAA